MRILQLTKKFPYPLKDGESVAIHYLAKGLHEIGCKVSLLSFNTFKHYSEVDEQEEHSRHYENVWTVDLDTSLQLWPMVKNLASKDSYNIQRFNDSEFQDRLTEVLVTEEFDLVQLEGLYLSPYISTIQKVSKARIVMRSHNLEYEIFSDLAHGESNPIKKIYYSLCSKRLNRHESEVMKSYDLLVSISEQDDVKYEAFGYAGPKVCIPVGMDFSSDSQFPEVEKEMLSIGFLGSLDWQPNVEGLRWFLPIWQEIYRNSKFLPFKIAGRGGKASLFTAYDDIIDYRGEVEDAKAFLDEVDILVVPLFSGSGIRVKIIEAMAQGKVVLSTNKGFEGIGVRHGQEGLLFDDKAGIKRIFKEFGNLDLKVMANNAFKHARSRFHYLELAQKLKQEYSDII